MEKSKLRKPVYLWAVLGLVIAGLVTLAAPTILGQRANARRTEKIEHLKQLRLALIDFDSQYGSFPSDETAADDPRFAGMNGARVLEQLEAAGLVADLDKLLRLPGESVGKWYYFPGGVTSGDPGLPVLIMPYGGDKVSVLRRDGSIGLETDPALLKKDLSGAIEISSKKR